MTSKREILAKVQLESFSLQVKIFLKGLSFSKQKDAK